LDLEEFKTLVTNGTLIIVPDSVKTNPGTSLFTKNATDPRVSTLSQNVRAQLRSILGGDKTSIDLTDVNKVGFTTGGEGINAFESDEMPKPADPAFGNVLAAFTGTARPETTRSSPISRTL